MMPIAGGPRGASRASRSAPSVPSDAASHAALRDALTASHRLYAMLPKLDGPSLRTKHLANGPVLSDTHDTDDPRRVSGTGASVFPELAPCAAPATRPRRRATRAGCARRGAPRAARVCAILVLMPWLRLTRAGDAIDARAQFLLREALRGPKPHFLAARLATGLPAFYEGAVADRALLDALGIVADVIDRPPERAAATAPALAAAWDPLRAWLVAAAPEALARLGPPAYRDDLVQLAHRVGAFDAEHASLLALHDGQTDSSGPFGSWDLLSVPGVADATAFLRDTMYGGAVDADPGVTPCWWSRGWVPVASRGTGDYLVVDLAPPPGGRRGQLIEYRHDDDRRPRIASSLAAWLTALRERLARGELVVTEDGGQYFRILDRAALTGSLATLSVRG